MYMHDWEESKREGMISDFGIYESDLEGVEIIYATYTYEDYSGSAYVLFRKDDKFYEVHGSHCSCWGLEEQWEPEEVSLADLFRRMDKCPTYYDGASESLMEMMVKLRDES